MATKKDLVEAQAFSKRRLTTAFVSGAPGGREVEPHRPLRAVIGGVALTTVLVLGSLAFGWLKGSLPNDWDDSKLIIAKTSGARYVSMAGTLHPVINTTSARLLIPPEKFKVITVDDDKIADKKRGATIGILGAPDSLTPATSLSTSGWVACLGANNTGGLGATVGPSARSDIPSGAAAVVRAGKQVFVLADGMRYPVSAANFSAVTIALRLDGQTPSVAPAAFVNLFPLGPELKPLVIDGLGKAASGLPPGATVGSVLSVSGGEAARRYLVTANGSLDPLTEVAHAMYAIGSGSAAQGKDIPATPAQLAALQVTPPTTAPSAWPSDLPSALTGPPCATLTDPNESGNRVALSTSSVVQVPATGVRTIVDTGSGALVRAVGEGTSAAGPLLAIDQTATAYAIDGNSTDLLQRLGYAAKDVTPVPQAWTELFRPGPVFSVKAAQTPVTASSG